MPCLSVGEKVPEVTSPIVVPSASSTAQPARGIPRPVTSRPPESLDSLASRWAVRASLPQKVSFFQPTAHPVRPITGVISRESSLPWSAYPISVRSVSREPSPQGSPSNGAIASTRASQTCSASSTRHTTSYPRSPV